MSTNINITVGGDSLVDQVKGQQQAVRQAQNEKENRARVEAEATAQREKQQRSEGKDANGAPLYGVPGAKPVLRSDPAASRSLYEIVWSPSPPTLTSSTGLAESWGPWYTNTLEVSTKPPRQWWPPSKQTGLRPLVSAAEPPPDASSWDSDYVSYANNAFYGDSNKLLTRGTGSGIITQRVINFSAIAGSIKNPKAKLRKILLQFEIQFTKDAFTVPPGFGSASYFQVVLYRSDSYSSRIELLAESYSVNNIGPTVESGVWYTVGVLLEPSRATKLLLNQVTQQSYQAVSTYSPSVFEGLLTAPTLDIYLRGSAGQDKFGSGSFPELPASWYVKNIRCRFW